MAYRLRQSACVWAILLPSQLVSGCGSSLPQPPHTRHPQESYVDVPYPPSGALTETVTPRPPQGGVWVDGDWRFRGRTYAWQRGGWFLPPPQARYAPSDVMYLRDGRIVFAPGTWYAENGEPIERPRPIVPAATPPNEVTSELQTGR